MKIKIHNHYEKLKSCMLGNVDFSVLSQMDEYKKTKLQVMLERAEVDLDKIQNKLETLGVKIFRPKSLNCDKKLVTPYFDTIGHRIPLNPADNFFVVDNTIIETASWTKEASFTGMYWRDIMRSALAEGNNWLTMPMPLHDVNEIDLMDQDIPNLDPIIDGPCLYIHDDYVFVSMVGASNDLGYEWMKNILPGKKFIEMDPTKFAGHLDCHFNILRPGVVATFHAKEDFPAYFDNWSFIQVDHVTQPTEFIDSRLQDDDQENSVLAVNSLSIDQSTILMTDTSKKLQKNFIQNLEQHNFDIEFVNFEHSHFFGSGLTCITLPLHRED